MESKRYFLFFKKTTVCKNAATHTDSINQLLKFIYCCSLLISTILSKDINVNGNNVKKVYCATQLNPN